ncbi:MAG: hypothetical protein ABSF70_13040 [Terracidiphilus sp.]|jgi:hypothetical protein
MGIDNVISEIDGEITKLHQARALLTGAASPAAKKRGRPAKAAGAAGAVKAVAKPAKKTKRTLSPEARKAIADAQRKRWAKLKRAAK